MQIGQLPASSSFSSTDVLPIEINGVTYKVTGATLAAALQTLGNYLTPDNVANNLTTTAAGSVLDARQGKALADDVGALSAAMTYVVSGNKSIETATIPVGAYVRLVGSTITGRSDGIYTVATAIPVNTVIDGTYFNESAPIPGGGLNALNASLNWKYAVSYSDAYNNAIAEIALIGKGRAASAAVGTICLTMIIPKILIDNTDVFYLVSDSYNGGIDYHLQAKLKSDGTSTNVGLFAGANPISNEQIQWLYR